MFAIFLLQNIIPTINEYVAKLSLARSMNKFGSDPKVKKTLVRNCEKKAKPIRKQVVREVVACSSKVTDKSSGLLREHELNEPTLCSSEALANYLSDVKLSAPQSLKVEDLNVDRSKITAKMTKKLNFHYNDRIYRNLIELNANIDDIKIRKEKRATTSASAKKDLEPNIEDFSEEIADQDSPPTIPVIKPKFKTVKKVENGHLHKLVLAFENL